MTDRTHKIAMKDGVMTYVYSDDLAPLLGVSGEVRTKRASLVEPGADGSWIADLRPSGGPVLTGFTLRSQALAAEVQWLDENIIDP